jgi:hypothetical protein
VIARVFGPSQGRPGGGAGNSDFSLRLVSVLSASTCRRNRERRHDHERARRYRKRGGRPEGGQKRTKRKARSIKTAAGGKEPGAARTVKDGRRNEQIAAEWRRGRDVSSLAAETGLRPRRVYEIIKQCREGEIEGLALNEPWRGRTFADELLVQKIAAINDAREIELLARETGNLPVQLGRSRLESYCPTSSRCSCGRRDDCEDSET